MNFLIVCGGSAGHINPGLAIASELCKRQPGAKVLFVGAGKALEKKLIPASGFHLVNIRMSGLRRSFSLENLIHNAKTVKNLTTAGIKAEKLVRRFKPDAVIGTGGYICYPILKKAAQMGIPTVIHGSDAVPGLTTKMLSATVDKVLVSFPGVEKQYRKPEKVFFTGTPVRAEFDFSLGEQVRASKSGKPLVVSFWGSLGAAHMNEVIAGMILKNAKSEEFDHIHATGKSGGVEGMKSCLRRIGMEGDLPQGIEIREYIEDMPTAMATADLILCRAGASTIAELTVLGKPAILVPSPNVTNNHQEPNAMQLHKSGGAVMMLEKDCTGEVLFKLVTGLLGDKDRLTRMAYAQKSLAAPNAAEKIVDIVLELCNN